MATRKGKGFAGIQDAANNPSTLKMTGGSPLSYDQMRANQQQLGPTGPDGPIDQSVLNAPALEPDETPEKHPIYDSQDGEDADSGHAHLMHDLGTAIQEMMQKDPETNKSMADLMEQFMGKGVDYEGEGKRLRELIEKRKTPKAPNWVAAGVGSWAGGPEVAQKFQQLQSAAAGGEAQKQRDIEDTDATLLKEHVEDLRARGKTKEALMLGLLQGTMAQKRAETAAQSRADLQERSLGAAEERVRMQINNRNDIADKDRTAQQVFHLYESLLRQSDKDITGAEKPRYSVEQAMDLAMNTILPKIKPGVAAAKGETPVAPEAAPAPQAKKQSKFAQWKAAQATRPAGK